VVECLPRKRKALGSVPSSEKKEPKKKKKKKENKLLQWRLKQTYKESYTLRNASNILPGGDIAFSTTEMGKEAI